MKKFAVLALLATAIAAVCVGSASAQPRARNGLIAFARFDPILQDDVAYTINPDGTGQRQLLAGAGTGGWSPDGRRIAVFRDDGSEQLVNPDNASFTALPTFYPDLAQGLFLPCPVWSPDGSRLACEGFGNEPGTNGVYTISSADGSGVQRVTSGADDDCPGSYSPDGKQIVFLRTFFDSGAQWLFTARTDGSDLRKITPDALNQVLISDCGSWSPQANEILFAARPVAGRRGAIFAVHSDGTGLRQIPIPGCGSVTVGCFGATWSPDGTKIAFTRLQAQDPPPAPGQQEDIYTVDPSGKNLRLVAQDVDGEPSWGSHPLNH